MQRTINESDNNLIDSKLAKPQEFNFPFFFFIMVNRCRAPHRRTTYRKLLDTHWYPLSVQWASLFQAVVTKKYEDKMN